MLAALLPSMPFAADFQSLDSIRSEAAAFIRAQLPAPAAQPGRKVLVEAGYLDARLRLAACAGNLAVTQPAGSILSARNTVAVSCTQGATWTVYVPVTLETETAVLVTRRAVNRGAALLAADVEEQARRVPGLADRYVSNVAELEGRHVRRNLPAGTALTDDTLATNILVKRGQQVTLLATVGGIEVRAVGRALGDGGNADRIRVQNSSSARIVEGFVESADIVRIGR
jgi:flagella basal body P-ring formation protein FlgA